MITALARMPITAVVHITIIDIITGAITGERRVWLRQSSFNEEARNQVPGFFSRLLGRSDSRFAAIPFPSPWFQHSQTCSCKPARAC
jgi:hypothetical protein